jgi:glycosyltransferase involved in cell wall biosynthesis
VSEPLITMVVPYYRQPKMLLKQLETWNSYSKEAQYAIDFIVVDDCSPEPAEPIIRDYAYHNMTMLSDPGFIQLYRIDKDVPWNRGMARNLGTKMATTPWVLHVDTDHVLPPDSAAYLVEFIESYKKFRWFRFARFRVGAADETRKKDKADPKAKFVEIHPHIDSYLCTPEAYWAAGGYNEDFSGVLGGGTPFLKEMARVNGEPFVLGNVPLHVHTRHSVPDSSEHTLPRDPEAFKRRKREIMAKRGTLRGHDPIRLPWHKVF